jgi:peptidyl-prolyl cis-trans isomerase SurA
MKKIFLLIIGVMAFSASMFAQENVIDEVIWVVGDDAILRSEVEIYRLQLQMNKQHLNGDPYCIIPEQMAIQKLYLHQAKLDSIEISESMAAQRAEARINNAINMTGSKEKLEEELGKPLSAIREDWKQSEKEELMVHTVQQNLIGTIKVNPSEVRNFYNRIPQDSLPFIATSVEVEIITVEPIVPLEEIDDIKRRLREYTEQITSGKREFSSLARLWSEDKVSAMRGGELGFQGKGMLLPEFATAAFELNDPKKVSRIVETEYGYHIIQLIEKRGDRINVRHILLRPKVSDKELDEAKVRLDTLRSDILNDRFTFEAAAYLSHDKDTRNNKGLMVNKGKEPDSNSPRIGTSRFEIDELPSEIARVVYGMKVGDISKPFTLVNANQKEVVAIVKLKSKIEGHKASLSEDFSELKSMVEYEKRQELLNKWVQKKIKGTYVRINENWRNCDFQMKGWIVVE